MHILRLLPTQPGAQPSLAMKGCKIDWTILFLKNVKRVMREKERVMRKIIFAITIAFAVAGAGFAAGSMISSQPAFAGCSSRC